MGAEWIDLNELARGLEPGNLAEVADFIGYLKSKQDRAVDSSMAAIEREGAAEMAANLAELERGLPPGRVQSWLDDLRSNAKPVRFNL